jgi:hypothetical protein
VDVVFLDLSVVEYAAKVIAEAVVEDVTETWSMLDTALVGKN